MKHANFIKSIFAAVALLAAGISPELSGIPDNSEYKAMCDDISLTHRGLESKLGLAKTTIRKATATLIHNGFIRRVGSKKGGHWEVIGQA